MRCVPFVVIRGIEDSSVQLDWPHGSVVFPLSAVPFVGTHRIPRAIVDKSKQRHLRLLPQMRSTQIMPISWPSWKANNLLLLLLLQQQPHWNKVRHQ